MVEIRFLGNACVEIIGQQDHVIIDPIFLIEPIRGIERIFLTHHHSDHVSQEKLDEIQKNYSIKEKELEIYGPFCVYEELTFDFILIVANSIINLINGYVKVYKNDCWKAPGCVAYLITLDNKKILHTADSASFSDELKSIKTEIDLCFVACFESNYNDYLEYLNKISPILTIPYHFSQEKENDAIKLSKFLIENNINSKFLRIGEKIKL
jgi:L-ascorbate metabolism protein UlaG (beta-lactamase superfamily)